MSQVYVCDRCGAIIRGGRKIRTVGIYDDFGPGKFDYQGYLCPECLKQLDLFMHTFTHTSRYKGE